jgi:hypothetical protein
MVRAILAGRKTQTRRVVTAMSARQSEWLTPEYLNKVPSMRMCRLIDGSGRWGAQMEHPGGGHGGWVSCPYYDEDGVRLWVRETWRTEERATDCVDGIRFRADDAFVPIANTREAAGLWIDSHENGKHGEKWRPSIFCKRWMSRLTLGVGSRRAATGYHRGRHSRRGRDGGARSQG